MAQQPSLSAATLINQRDDVASEAFGVAGYSDLSSTKQSELTTEGNAAFYEVTQWARWYTEVSPDSVDLPSEWNEAFRHVWVAKCKRRWRSPQDFHAHWTQYVAPLLERIADHYTADWNSASALQDDSFSVQSLRQSAMAIVVRQRTPIFPPVREVDRIIRDEFVKLWNERKWEFRKRPVKLTITTAGDVQAAESFIFDGMLSKHMTIKHTSGRTTIEWVDATRAADLLAVYDGQTGVPMFFYDVDKGDTKSIQFIPMPDAEYTAFAVIYIGAPAFASAANSTETVSLLPVEFRINLRDFIVAKIVHNWGREDTDASRLLGVAQSERDRLAQAWDDKGASRARIRGHHHRSFINDLMSFRGGNVLGNQW